MQVYGLCINGIMNKSITVVLYAFFYALLQAINPDEIPLTPEAFTTQFQEKYHKRNYINNRSFLRSGFVRDSGSPKKIKVSPIKKLFYNVSDKKELDADIFKKSNITFKKYRHNINGKHNNNINGRSSLHGNNKHHHEQKQQQRQMISSPIDNINDENVGKPYGDPDNYQTIGDGVYLLNNPTNKMNKRLSVKSIKDNLPDTEKTLDALIGNLEEEDEGIMKGNRVEATSPSLKQLDNKSVANKEINNIDKDLLSTELSNSDKFPDLSSNIEGVVPHEIDLIKQLQKKLREDDKEENDNLKYNEDSIAKSMKDASDDNKKHIDNVAKAVENNDLDFIKENPLAIAPSEQSGDNTNSFKKDSTVNFNKNSINYLKESKAPQKRFKYKNNYGNKNSPPIVIIGGSISSRESNKRHHPLRKNRNKSQYKDINTKIDIMKHNKEKLFADTGFFMADEGDIADLNKKTEDYVDNNVNASVIKIIGPSQPKSSESIESIDDIQSLGQPISRPKFKNKQDEDLFNMLNKTLDFKTLRHRGNSKTVSNDHIVDVSNQAGITQVDLYLLNKNKRRRKHQKVQNENIRKANTPELSSINTPVEENSNFEDVEDVSLNEATNNQAKQMYGEVNQNSMFGSKAALDNAQSPHIEGNENKHDDLNIQEAINSEELNNAMKESDLKGLNQIQSELDFQDTKNAIDYFNQPEKGASKSVSNHRTSSNSIADLTEQIKEAETKLDADEDSTQQKSSQPKTDQQKVKIILHIPESLSHSKHQQQQHQEKNKKDGSDLDSTNALNILTEQAKAFLNNDQTKEVLIKNKASSDTTNKDLLDSEQKNENLDEFKYENNGRDEVKNNNKIYSNTKLNNNKNSDNNNSDNDDIIVTNSDDNNNNNDSSKNQIDNETLEAAKKIEEFIKEESKKKKSKNEDDDGLKFNSKPITAIINRLINKKKKKHEDAVTNDIQEDIEPTKNLEYDNNNNNGDIDSLQKENITSTFEQQNDNMEIKTTPSSTFNLTDNIKNPTTSNNEENQKLSTKNVNLKDLSLTKSLLELQQDQNLPEINPKETTTIKNTNANKEEEMTDIPHKKMNTLNNPHPTIMKPSPNTLLQDLQGQSLNKEKVKTITLKREPEKMEDSFSQGVLKPGGVMPLRINGGKVLGGSVRGGGIFGGIVSGGELIGGEIHGGKMTGGVFKNGFFLDGLFENGTIEGGKITGGKISGGDIKSGLIEGGEVRGGVVEGGHLINGTIEGGDFKGGDIYGGTLINGEMDGGIMKNGSIRGGLMKGGIIESGVLEGGIMLSGVLRGGVVKSGVIRGGVIDKGVVVQDAEIGPGVEIHEGTIKGGKITVNSLPQVIPAIQDASFSSPPIPEGFHTDDNRSNIMYSIQVLPKPSDSNNTSLNKTVVGIPIEHTHKTLASNVLNSEKEKGENLKDDKTFLFNSLNTMGGEIGDQTKKKESTPPKINHSFKPTVKVIKTIPKIQKHRKPTKTSATKKIILEKSTHLFRNTLPLSPKITPRILAKQLLQQQGTLKAIDALRGHSYRKHEGYDKNLLNMFETSSKIDEEQLLQKYQTSERITDDSQRKRNKKGNDDMPIAHWALTQATKNSIKGTPGAKLRLSGGVVIRHGHAILDGINGYFDGGDYQGECMSDPEVCSSGFTIQMTVKLYRDSVFNNSRLFIFDSGATSLDSRGISVWVNNGKIAAQVSTREDVFCTRKILEPYIEKWITLTVSWRKDKGLHLYINCNLFDDSSSHEISECEGCTSCHQTDRATRLMIGRPNKGPHFKVIRMAVGDILLLSKFSDKDAVKNICGSQDTQPITHADTNNVLSNTPPYMPVQRHLQNQHYSLTNDLGGKQTYANENNIELNQDLVNSAPSPSNLVLTHNDGTPELPSAVKPHPSNHPTKSNMQKSDPYKPQIPAPPSPFVVHINTEHSGKEQLPYLWPTPSSAMRREAAMQPTMKHRTHVWPTPAFKVNTPTKPPQKTVGKGFVDYNADRRSLQTPSSEEGSYNTNGGYSEWTGWSPCSQACGPGFEMAVRYCNSPVPKGSGEECIHLGAPRKFRECNLKKCQETNYETTQTAIKLDYGTKKSMVPSSDSRAPPMIIINGQQESFQDLESAFEQLKHR